MSSEGELALFGNISIDSDLLIVTCAAAIEVRALFAAVRRLKWMLEGSIPAGLTRMPIHLSP